VIGDGSGIVGGTDNLLGTPSQPIDPLLAPLGEYGGPTLTMPLLPGSPAKGAGTTTEGAPNTDQRGFPRAGGIDIGAFQQSPGSTLVVDDATDDAGTAPSHLSLRQAVNLAALFPVVETIAFDPAVFGTTPHTITLTQGQLALDDRATTTITGPGANLLTVSGGGKSRVFYIEGGSATISGLTLSGGHADAGGGLYDNGATVSLSDCIISGNSATDGGGLKNAGTLSLTNCTVSGNSASFYGGGLFSRGTLSLTDCTVSGNSADDSGGGLFIVFGTATLTHCTVSGNSATNTYLRGNGGGFYVKEGQAQLVGCTVSGNSAVHWGGGLDTEGSATALTNCTLSGNTAGSGGGLFNYSFSGYPNNTPLTNCTVSGNFAAHGGGLCIYGYENGGHYATITLANTIVAGQKGGSDIIVHNGTVTGSYNLIGDGSGISGGTGNLLGSPSNPINPLLAPLGDYGGPTQTMALLPGSPAIGAGTTSGAPATDERAQPRTGPVDIGAFQSRGFSLTPVAGSTPQSALVGATFAHPLAVTVTAVNPIEPVDGGVVTFAAPTTGASAALSTATAVIADGQAAVSATANTTAGAYTVTARAAGDTTAASFGLTNTTLNLVAQPVAAVANRAFTNVVVATFTDSIPNANPGDFVAAIDWGDGITTSSTTVIADGQGRFDVLGTHTYVDAGSYTFRVQVTDSSGASATATSTATVTANANTEAPGPVRATPHDVVLEFDDLTSLRAAIAYANSHPGPETIIFDPAVTRTKHWTIRLSGGPLVLTDPATITIIGPGAGLLTLKGNGRSRVFDIRGGSLALSGLTITGGRANRGGGIRNDGGTLWLTDIMIRNNFARRSGGGLFNGGTATLTDVILRGNHARAGEDIANFGTLSLTRVTIPGNTALLGSGLFSSRAATLVRAGRNA
jgi:hypothetical protein